MNDICEYTDSVQYSEIHVQYIQTGSEAHQPTTN
jgi:hypothetical protein